MKLFVLIPFLVSFAYAGVGRQAWHGADLQGKVTLMRAYAEWYGEASKEKSAAVVRLPSFISEAWASLEGMDCVYAGWPSKRVSGSCSTPVRQNPNYQAGACGANTLQCQPTFFGPGLCAPAATSQQRSLAFSNCRQQFQRAGRNHVDVVTDLLRAGKEEELLELMDFAEGVCRQGAQSSTGMCRRLEEVVSSVRQAYDSLRGTVRTVEEVVAAVGAIQPPVACVLPQPSPLALIASPVAPIALTTTFTPVPPAPVVAPPAPAERAPANLADFAQRADPCATLAVGQTKVVGREPRDNDRDPSNALTHADSSAMGVDTSYALSRTGRNSYVATVAINFRNGTGGSDALTAEMAQRANRCMAQQSAGLRGPNGQSLEVRIVSPPGSNQNPHSELPTNLQPRPLTVNVLPGDSRGNAGNFSASFDCETIAHEVMHMLGLVDEYHEPANNGGECRVVTNHVNIMNDMHAAAAQSQHASRTCVCDQDCQAIMGSADSAQREFFAAPRLSDVMSTQLAHVLCAKIEESDLGTWDDVESRPTALALGSSTSRLEVMQSFLQRRNGETHITQSTYACGCGDASDTWCAQTEGLSESERQDRQSICQRRRDNGSCSAILAQARRSMQSGASLRLRSCPQGSSQHSGAPISSGREFALTDYANGLQSFNFYTDGVPNTSMLAPAHFARILAGQCGEGAENYNRCAAFANARNRVEVDEDGIRRRNPAGELISEPISCETDLPAECRDEAFYLGLNPRRDTPPRSEEPRRETPRAPAQAEPSALPQPQTPSTSSVGRAQVTPTPTPVSAAPGRSASSVDATEEAEVAAAAGTSAVPYLREEPRELCNLSSGVDGLANFMHIVSSCAGGARTGAVILQAPAGNENRPRRRIQINATDGAFAGVYLHVEEEISPQDSHNQKSVILLIPRRSLPHTEFVGNEIRVTLPTGELVVFDRATNAIIRGALREGPMDMNPDRHARRPPNVEYTGSGISIRASHRYQDPRVREVGMENGRQVVYEGNPTFEVRQGSRTCTIPRGQIWTDAGLIRGTDEAIVAAINRACPARSGQQPFTL